MESKEQFGRLSDSYKTLSQTFGYIWADTLFIGVGAFIFGFYQVALNCLYTLIVSLLLSCLFAIMYVRRLKKECINSPDGESSDVSDKYKEYLRRSQKAVEEVKAKQAIKDNLNDRAN